MPTFSVKGSKSDRLLLSPQEALIAGGPAEELERRIQEVFKLGYEHVVIDLRGVPSADSAGIRALVRGHTSAQRLSRRFTVVSPNPKVMELLELSLLTRVLEVVDTLVEAKTKTVQWDRVWAGLAVALVGTALVGIGMKWPGLGLAENTTSSAIPGVTDAQAGGITLNHPLFELAKLIASAVIGMLVTVVHRQYRHERTANPALDQAQVLLCISGAIMMIIIGNSVARAFGIAGAASIIRFRTPVEDARDITILFILMGPRHGRRARRAGRRRPRHAVPVRDDSDPQRVQFGAAAPDARGDRGGRARLPDGARVSRVRGERHPVRTARSLAGR
jgi:anti-anti-sigma factor